LDRPWLLLGPDLVGPLPGLEGTAGAAGVNCGCEPTVGDVPDIAEDGARGTETDGTVTCGIEPAIIGDETRGALG